MSGSIYNNLFSIVLLNSIVKLPKPLNKYLSQRIVTKHFKKGEFIVVNGEQSDRIYIIRKGLVRGFFNYDNNEITTWASVDNEMVTSISGFFRKEPALENIQCVEDTFTESLSYSDLHFAIENYKEMARLYRVLIEQYYIEAEYRAFTARIPIAKDRYAYFKENGNSEIFNRLPKKYLASLLNMRPETLSRLES